MGTLLVLAIIIYMGGFFFMAGYASGKKKLLYEENTGEQIVNNILSQNFAKGNYHLLKNITLPIAGGTTQIDHVLVSTKGIFVIETKHYTGWVFGQPKQPKWTQTTRWGKYKFQNPLHQNHKHTKELVRYLDFLPESCFKSIVVFTGDGEFKTSMPDNVFYDTGLVHYINQFGRDVMTLEQLFIVVGKLEFFRKEISHQTDLDHINYLTTQFGLKDAAKPSQQLTEDDIAKQARPGETKGAVIARLTGTSIADIARPGESFDQALARKREWQDLKRYLR